MPKDTLALILHGEVSLEDFAEAIERLSALVENLTREVAFSSDIEWEIAQLKSSSPTTIVKGISKNLIDVEKVIQAYGIVGQAMEMDKPIPYSEAVAREARAISGILNGKITSVEFKTDDYEAIVEKPLTDEESAEKDYSIGTVTGYVETLSKHGRLRFIIYDMLFGRAVICYLSDKFEKEMLDAWDRRVSVAGKVYRDPDTGRPEEIRDINYIKVHEEVPPGAFMAAQGVLPWKEGDELPEQIIRRLRDAG